jgi:hypothetical protein
MFKTNKLYRSGIYATTLMVVAFVLIGASCSNKATTPTVSSTPTSTSTTSGTIDLTNVDPTAQNSTILTNASQARLKANEWRNNSQMVYYSVKLPRDLRLNNATESFVFGSSSEPNYWWVYSLAESSGIFLRSLYYKTDYLGNTIQPIPDKYWKSNYIQAFQKAETYQGKAFRDANPNTDVTINLFVTNPNSWLWWNVEYKSTNGKTLKVRVHPSELKIYDDLGNVVTSTTQSDVTATPTATITPTTAQ